MKWGSLWAVFILTSLRRAGAGPGKRRALQHQQGRWRTGAGFGGRLSGWLGWQLQRCIDITDLALHVVDLPLAVVHLDIDVALIVEIAVGVFPRFDPQPQDAGLGT